MRRVFVVNGLPGTGKSLFGSLVGEELARRNIDFLHTSSIDLVKQVLLPQSSWDEAVVPRDMWEVLGRLKRGVTEFDWDGRTKDVYWRGVMSNLKLSIVALDPDLINQWVWSRIESTQNDGVVFVDIREPENIIAFREYCYVVDTEVCVRTVCLVSDLNADYDNPSDGRVSEFDYDVRISNERARFDGNMEEALNNLCEAVVRFVDVEVMCSGGGPEKCRI